MSNPKIRSKSYELFSDPPDKKTIIQNILDSKTHGDIFAIIKRVFPSWILGASNSYSLDYPHLQSNWIKVCEKIDTQPTKILIVDFIDCDESHTLIPIFCELMTRAGYCVRRKEEFISCPHCEKIIPNLEIHKKMILRKLNIPPEWSKKCSDCPAN